mgnify:CR=1 FL=1
MGIRNQPAIKPHTNEISEVWAIRTQIKPITRATTANKENLDSDLVVPVFRENVKRVCRMYANGWTARVAMMFE